MTTNEFTDYLKILEMSWISLKDNVVLWFVQAEVNSDKLIFVGSLFLKHLQQRSRQVFLPYFVEDAPGNNPLLMFTKVASHILLRTLLKLTPGNNPLLMFTKVTSHIWFLLNWFNKNQDEHIWKLKVEEHVTLQPQSYLRFPLDHTGCLWHVKILQEKILKQKCYRFFLTCVCFQGSQVWQHIGGPSGRRR